MPDYVFDSNVLIADILQEQTANNYARVKPYTDELKAGNTTAHMPQLGLIETCGALRRQAGLSLALATKATFAQWVSNGQLSLHDLDDSRTTLAVDMALQYGLKGADATYAALSQELGVTLITLDRNSLAVPLQNGGYSLVAVP